MTGRLLHRGLIGLAAMLWALGLVRILSPFAVLDAPLGALLVVFVIVALFRTGWQNRALCLALAGATAGLCAAYDLWRVIPDGIAKGAIFPAFFGTIVLLRATADQRPEIAVARRLFAGLDPARRGGGLIVVGMTALTPLSTLESLVLGMPLPCLLAIARAPAGDLRAALRTTGDGLTRIGPETSILCFAMALGVAFEAALPQTGLLDRIGALALSPTAVVFIVIFGMNLTGFLAIHPIVTGTMLLVVFTALPTGVADLVLMQAMLVGWGLCTAISLGSLAVVTGSVMFDLPPTRLISPTNIAYVVVTSAVFALILAVLNGFLTA